MIHLFLLLFSFSCAAAQQSFNLFDKPSASQAGIANLTTGETLIVVLDNLPTPTFIMRKISAQNTNISSNGTYVPSGNVNSSISVLGLPNGKFVVYWQSWGSGTITSYNSSYQVFNNDFSKYGPQTQTLAASDITFNSDIKMINYSGNLGIIWISDRYVYFRVLTDDGTQYASLNNTLTIITFPDSPGIPVFYDVFSDSSGHLIFAINENSYQTIVAYPLSVASNTVTAGTTFTVATFDANYMKTFPWPSTRSIMSNGNIFYAFCQTDVNTFTILPYYRIISPNGTVVTAETLINNDESKNQVEVICLPNGNCVYFITFMYDYPMYLFYSVFAPNGTIISNNTISSVYDFQVVSNGDGFILLYQSSAPPGIYTLLPFNSDGKPIYCNITCISPKILSPDKQSCVISGCLTSNANGSCDSCNTSTVRTISGAACAIPIDNCSTYSDDMNCLTCQANYHLTVGNKACAPTIINCSTYWDNKTCQSCLNSGEFVTVSGLVCSPPIVNCLSYFDNKTCQSCNNSNIVTAGGIACATPIQGCINYTDNKLCATCNATTRLTVGAVACANIILNCSVYSDDKVCQTCNNGSVLNGSNICLTRINNCSIYGENSTCSICNSSKILSIDNFACVEPIIDCVEYLNDGMCNSCINGTVISTDKLSCVESNLTQQNQTFRSQVFFGVTNYSLQGTALPKEKMHSLTITYQNYNLSLYDSLITLQSDNITINVLPLSVDSSILGNLTVNLNLSNISSDNYYFKMNITMQKLARRILQQGLPTYFIFSYQSPQKYYIGTQLEIQNRNQTNTKNGTNSTNATNATNGTNENNGTIDKNGTNTNNATTNDTTGGNGTLSGNGSINDNGTTSGNGSSNWNDTNIGNGSTNENGSTNGNGSSNGNGSTNGNGNYSQESENTGGTSENWNSELFAILFSILGFFTIIIVGILCAYYRKKTQKKQFYKSANEKKEEENKDNNDLLSSPL